MKRKGNSDYVETDRGPRPVRVFSPAAGTWRVTRTGKRWFNRPDQQPSEVVVQVLATIYTTKNARDAPVEHYGWFPVTDLPTDVKAAIDAAFPIPGRDTAAHPLRDIVLQEIKDDVMTKLGHRVDATTGEVVLHWESDQLITLDTGRDWHFSLLRTKIV